MCGYKPLNKKTALPQAVVSSLPQGGLETTITEDTDGIGTFCYHYVKVSLSEDLT